MSQNGFPGFWRRFTSYFGVESIVFARERRARETTQDREISTLRSEVDELKRRLNEVERTSATDR